MQSDSVALVSARRVVALFNGAWPCKPYEADFGTRCKTFTMVSALKGDDGPPSWPQSPQQQLQTQTRQIQQKMPQQSPPPGWQTCGGFSVRARINFCTIWVDSMFCASSERPEPHRLQHSHIYVRDCAVDT